VASAVSEGLFVDRSGVAERAIVVRCCAVAVALRSRANGRGLERCGAVSVESGAVSVDEAVLRVSSPWLSDASLGVGTLR